MNPITVITDEVRQRMIEELTAPNAPYELATGTIGGVEYPVFKSCPQNLKAVYAQGTDKEAFISQAITRWYGERDWDFMVYQDERYTFSETYRLAARLAWRIQDAFEIQKGDRVAIAMRNYPEFCIAFMAITALGAVAVPMNAWWQGAEMQYGLQHSDPKLIFADPQRAERMAPYLADPKIPVIVVRAVDGMPDSFIAYDDLMADATETEFPEVEADLDDDAYIMYTSGSTAHPKGVVSTHRAVIHTLMSWELGGLGLLYLNRDYLDEMRPEYKSGSILTVPLFHLTGLCQFLGSFRAKRKMAMMYKWDPEEALRLIEKERITQFVGVPSMSWEITNSPNFKKHDTSSLMVLGGGGAARPSKHVKEMEKRVGSNIASIGYGMTETTALGSGNGGDDYSAKPDSVGRATPPVMKIKIIDTDGKTVEAGELGEVCFKSPTNLRCYWKDPEATAEISLGDGWIRSGDVGMMDEDDFIYIKDRIKDLIIRGGENIACRDVEDALHEHPNVFEAAVFGLPEERLGEQVAAVVMIREGCDLTEQELLDFLESRLARFKIPSIIYLQREPLPRGATGKIFKKKIREEKSKELQG